MIIIKKAWSDLKSFVTIAMITILFIIVIGNLYGLKLEDNILINKIMIIMKKANNYDILFL